MRTSKLLPTFALVLSSNLLTLIVFFSLDFLAEKVNRLYFGAQPDRYVHIPITEFHHGLAPNKSYVAHWGDREYKFFTNSLGLRDSSNREVPLQANHKRILFVGDSMTEALGIPYEQAFVGQIAAKLERNNIEVLNAGTVSYSALIYWKKTAYLIEKLGFSIDHVVVMIDISDIYDSTTYTLDRHGNVISRRFRVRVLQFIHDNTIVCAQLSNLLYGYYNRAKYWNFEGNREAQPSNVIAINHHHSLWTVRDELYRSYGRVGLETESYNLGELTKLLRKRGIKLTIAVYPWPDQIWYNDYNSRQVTHWESWARENDVNFINLFPAFFSGNTKNAREIIEENYIPGDVHWNEKGHETAARHLLKFLANGE